MASVFKRGKSWYVRWYDQNGKRRAKSFGQGRIAERTAKIYALKDKPENNYMTFDDVADMYVLYKESTVSQKQVDEIKRTIDLFKRYTGIVSSEYFNQYCIDLFLLARKKDKVCRNKDNKPGKKISERTINKDLSHLQTLFKWAKRRGYITGDIDFPRLKEYKTQFNPPSQQQLSDVIRYTRKYPALYIRTIIAFTTGLRAGAINSVQLDARAKNHINFETNTITTTEKGGDTITTPLSDSLIKEIIEYVHTLPEGTKRLINRHPRTVSRQWEKCREKANCPDFKFHDIRKMITNTLGKKGVSSMIAQRTLNHKSLSTTARHYAYIDNKDKKVVADMLTDYINVLCENDNTE